MKVLRTPEERFAVLPDHGFAPRYSEIPDGEGGSLRVHHVDEGPADGPTVILMHGEPTWSYLYRHVIARLIAAGVRCIAPDLVGFGRSDKPTELSDYTYDRHVRWMSSLLVDALDVRDAVLFGQDWGGLIGLRLVGEAPERYRGVVVSNTGLPAGDGKVTDAFLAWQRYSREAPVLAIGRLVDGGCTRALGPAEVAAYDAPFPDDAYKAGARIFPSLMPFTPDDPGAAGAIAAWDVLEGFDRPFLCAFSDGDPITRGGDRPFLRRVPGAVGQPHRTIEGAGHFVQEDAPDAVVDAVLTVLRSAGR